MTVNCISYILPNILASLHSAYYQNSFSYLLVSSMKSEYIIILIDILEAM